MQQQLQLADRVQHTIQVGVRFEMTMEVHPRSVESTPHPTDPIHADFFTLLGHANTSSLSATLRNARSEIWFPCKRNVPTA